MRWSRSVAPLAVAAALAVAAIDARPARSERVDAFVASGKTATLTVTGAGDTATAGFLVQDGPGKRVSIVVRNTRGSKLAPSVSLVAPDGATVDPATLPGGRVVALATQTTISFTDVPEGRAGLWRVEVRGASGSSGACTVTFRSKDVTAVSELKSIPAASSANVLVDAGSNQALTITVKRAAGSRILPRIRIFDPNGVAMNGGDFVGKANGRTGLLAVRAYRLPVFGRYTVSVTSTDGTAGSVSVVAKTAAARPSRRAPVASPGAPFEVEVETRASLNGSASQGAAALTYVWTQVAGPAVTLSGAATSRPSFDAPSTSASLGFELAVAANGVWSAPLPVTVEVGPRPLADAGRSLAVATASPVTLDGTGSLDRRGRGLLHAWRQHPLDAVKVTLAGAATANPTFTSPGQAAVLRFGLTVDDGALRSDEDFVTVRVGDAGQPVADAGREQVVPRMATVHLSALRTLTASGALDTALAWTQTAGPAVTLDDPSSPFPAFTAPKVFADLEFELTAGGTDAKDRVRVHVRPAETNLAPLSRANASQAVAPGAFALTAAASTDPNSDALSARWAQIAGPALAPAAPDVTATSVDVPAAAAIRTYAVQVRDALAYGPPDLVTVRTTGYAGLPVANAGADVTVTNVGGTARLLGSGVLTQGPGPLTYRWRQVSAKDWFDVDVKVPAFDPAAAQPQFSLPANQSSLTTRRSMTFELVVNDGAADSAPDYVTVTFVNLPLNGKPVVGAGASSTNPLPGDLVTLQGTVQPDPDGDTVVVQWSQRSGPAVTLSATDVLTPTFTAPASGTLVFDLVGNDGIELGAPASVTVVVDRVPTASMTLSPTSGAPGTAVTIDGRASSDPEGRTLTFTLTQTSGPTATVTAGGQAGTWTFDAPSATCRFQLVVNDGRQDSAPATGTFTVGVPVVLATPTASLPNAPYGATVTLSASATSGSPTSWTWTQLTTGPNATDPLVGTISNAGSATASFRAPSPTGSTGFGASPGATFQITASNGSGTDTRTVRVTFFASFRDVGGSGTGSANTVYGIISSNCLGCHTGTNASSSPYGMGTAAAFLANSVSRTAAASSKFRIAGGATALTNSFLIDRVKGIGGSQMGSLSATQIRLIEDWATQGASDN